jgi:hypothetical protein
MSKKIQKTKRRAARSGRKARIASKAKPGTVPSVVEVYQENHRRLMAKIRAISSEVREFEADVPVCDPITGEALFHYTNAQKVFDVYRKQCEKHNLMLVPDGSWPPVIVSDRGLVTVAMPYLVTDLDTGATFRTVGIGSGWNDDWAANTANTRCRKQAELTLFDALWRDPEEMRRNRGEQDLSASLGFDIRQIQNPKLLGDLMKEFFGHIRNKLAAAAQPPKKEGNQ